MTRNVGIFIFDDVELLDFCGPLEVFSVANENQDKAIFNVYTIAETHKPIATKNKLTVLPSYAIYDCPGPDVLIIPGGIGTRVLMSNATILNWIIKMYGGVELLLSVCTGSLVLAVAGLLNGLKITTHHSALSLLKECAPTSEVVANQRFIDNGKIITSAGISAGVDMSLYVVEKLCGYDLAKAAAVYMEYGHNKYTSNFL